MFPSELALLVALRAFGVIIPIGRPGLGRQHLVALVVFLSDLVIDAPLLPLVVMSKGQGSGKQYPREGQDGEGNFLQMGKHKIVSLSLGIGVQQTMLRGAGKSTCCLVWSCVIVGPHACQNWRVRGTLAKH
jgi:hypothetical protein